MLVQFLILNTKEQLFALHHRVCAQEVHAIITIAMVKALVIQQMERALVKQTIMEVTHTLANIWFALAVHQLLRVAAGTELAPKQLDNALVKQDTVAWIALVKAVH